MEKSTAIHEAIRKHHSERGLAKVIGVSQVAINRAKKRAESGHPFSPRMARLLADELNIPRGQLRPDLWPLPESEAAE